MVEYPWLKNYDVGVPHTLQPYPARTMIEVVDESAAAKPYRAFLYFQGSKLLYDDFVRSSDALAAGLAAAGVCRNDRVALVLPNCPQLILGLHAVWKAGAIAVPVNPYYTEHELELVFNEVGVTAVIALTPFYQAVKNIQPRTGVRTVIATSIKEYLPQHKRLLFGVVMEKEKGHHIDLQQGDRWFQELIAKYKNSKRPAVNVSPSDPAVILFSGGTTGIPMGAVGTHQAMVMSAMQIQAWLKPALEEWDDRFLLPLPLYHVFGCIGSLGTAMINHSSCILVPDPRDMADVLKNIGKYKPAFMPGVSTFFINMMKHPLVRNGKISLKSIKISVGGNLPL
jgi:long-chain acyl-CoA synthetase